MNSPHQKKGGFGCLGYGCLIAVIIALLGAGGLFFFVRSGMRTALDSYTTGGPVAIPTVVVDQGAIDAALQKEQELRRLFTDSHASGEVVLTQSDVNGLLVSSKWSERVSVTMSGESVSGQFSFQMSDLGGWERASVFIGDKLNRYVTGSATATGSVENGQVRVDLKDLTLNGHAFDADSSKFASEWVSGAIQSPAEGGQRPLAARLERIWIANGEVHIRVKGE
jgi:hypothetical protein